MLINRSLIDFDNDGDIDGKDIRSMVLEFDSVCLKNFAENLGRSSFFLENNVGYKNVFDNGRISFWY